MFTKFGGHGCMLQFFKFYYFLFFQSMSMPLKGRVPITLHCGITPISSCNQVELDEMFMSIKFGTVNVTKFHNLLPQYSLSLTLLRVCFGQASVTPFCGINHLHSNVLKFFYLFLLGYNQ